jgi:hypothetical protein
MYRGVQSDALPLTAVVPETVTVWLCVLLEFIVAEVPDIDTVWVWSTEASPKLIPVAAA